MNTFRKYLTVFCMVMMIGTSSTAFAKSVVTTPNHVIAGHNGMYIKTAEGLVPVNSIVESQDGCPFHKNNPELSLHILKKNLNNS